MFAVMKTGGKQYKVAKDDLLRVERINAEMGETVQFNDILMVGDTVGVPMVAGAAVQAEVVEQIRGDKVISFKKRRRKHSSQRRKGHRQYLTVIRVTDILASGADKTGVKTALGSGSLDRDAARALTPVKGPDGKVIAAAAAAPATTSAPKAEAAPEAEAARPANLLDAAQGEADDLKKISGVGPKLEGLLHENGVFHFWQISEWGPGEIAYMDDKLSFKGRIERDNWIAQATELAGKA